MKKYLFSLIALNNLFLKSPKAKQHNNNCLFMASRITNKY